MAKKKPNSKKKPPRNRRSDRARKPKKELAHIQRNLSDGNGEITAHERFKDVDEVGSSMFAARDQVAEWDQSRKDALEQIEEMLIEKGFEGIYYMDHAGSKYEFEIVPSQKLAVRKCKKKDLEFAE